MAVTDTQTCRLCGEEKSLPSFPKRAALANGRDKRCRVCLAAYYQTRREQKLAYQKARSEDPAVRERAAARQRRARSVSGALDDAQRKARYYAKTERNRAAERARLAAKQQELNTIKDAPCTDCGGRFHPAAMHFDHVRGTKRYNINAQNLRRADLAEELAKCELRCANCHATRHAREREAARG